MQNVAQNSRSTIARLQREALEKGAELSRITSQVDSKKSELGAVEKRIFDARAELERLEGKITTKQGEYNNLLLTEDRLKKKVESLEHSIVEKEATIVGQDYCIEQNVWTIQKAESHIRGLSDEETKQKAALQLAKDAVATEERNVNAWVIKRDKLIKEAGEAEARRDAALTAEHIATENAKKTRLSTKLVPVKINRPVQ